MIKEKFPSYKNEDSIAVGKKMLEKHPQYLKRVKTDIKKGSPFPTSPQSTNFTPQAPKRNVPTTQAPRTQRNIPVESLAGAAQSVSSFIPRQLGGIANIGTRIGKWLGQAQEKIFGLPEQKTPKALTGLGGKLISLGDKAEQATKERTRKLWIDPESTTAKWWKLIANVLQSIGGTTKGIALPKAWIKELGKFAWKAGLVGLWEEARYNLGTEWSLVWEDNTNYVVWPLAEILLPLGVDKVSKMFANKSTQKAINSIVEQYKRGDIDKSKAILDIISESSDPLTQKEISAWLTEDVANRIAQKQEKFIEYLNISKARKKSDTAPTPMRRAEKQAEEAAKQLEEQLKKTWTDIWQFKKSIEKKSVSPTSVKKLQDDFSNKLSEYNLTIKNWKVQRKPNTVSLWVSRWDINALNELYNDFKVLDSNKNMKTLFEFLSSVRTKANFETKMWGAGTDNLDQIAKYLSNRTRQIGRESMESTKRKLFDEYSNLVTFLKDVNKYRNSRSWFGLLLRRVLSAKGGDALDMFETVKKYTGIDLMDDAQMARLAVELVWGDSQKTLLQQTIKDSGVDAIESVLNVADQPVTGLYRAIKNILPKSDPVEVFRKVAQKRKPWMTYQEAQRIIDNATK